MTLEEIFVILNRRCYESKGECSRCIFKPLYSLLHPSIKCLLLELQEIFGYSMQPRKPQKEIEVLEPKELSEALPGTPEFVPPKAKKWRMEEFK